MYLVLLSVNIIILSLNRLTGLTQLHLQPFEFLRLLDFNAMLPIPLMAVLLYYLIKSEITGDHPFRKTALYVFLSILFIAGIYLFAAGSGTHEVTNYLHFRFCTTGQSDSAFCNIIKYNDDAFSHYVYYAGFILMNIALMLIEAKMPRKKPVSGKDLLFISVNSLFIGLGIFANLAFEEIGIDMYIFTFVMLFAIYLLYPFRIKLKKLPIVFYFASSYSLGVISTLIYRSFLSK